jgi:hypothetical protein
MKTTLSELKTGTLIMVVLIAIFIVAFIKATIFVLDKNQKICDSRFGLGWKYTPTLNSGYCFNKEDGIRKYLD